MRGTVAKKLRRLAKSLADAPGKPEKKIYKMLKRKYHQK